MGGVWPRKDTVCPRSSDPFYVVTYYIKWVTTSWTDGQYTYIPVSTQDHRLVVSVHEGLDHVHGNGEDDGGVFLCRDAGQGLHVPQLKHRKRS